MSHDGGCRQARKSLSYPLRLLPETLFCVPNLALPSCPVLAALPRRDAGGHQRGGELGADPDLGVPGECAPFARRARPAALQTQGRVRSWKARAVLPRPLRSVGTPGKAGCSWGKQVERVPRAAGELCLVPGFLQPGTVGFNPLLPRLVI